MAHKAKIFTIWPFIEIFANLYLMHIYYFILCLDPKDSPDSYSGTKLVEFQIIFIKKDNTYFRISDIWLKTLV